MTNTDNKRYLIIDVAEDIIVEEIMAEDYGDFLTKVNKSKAMLGDYKDCRAYIECGGDFQAHLAEKFPKPIDVH